MEFIKLFVDYTAYWMLGISINAALTGRNVDLFDIIVAVVVCLPLALIIYFIR